MSDFMNEILNLFLKRILLYWPSMESKVITCFMYWVPLGYFYVNSWIKSTTGRTLYLFSKGIFTLHLRCQIWKQIIQKHGDHNHFWTEFIFDLLWYTWSYIWSALRWSSLIVFQCFFYCLGSPSGLVCLFKEYNQWWVIWGKNWHDNMQAFGSC